MRKDTDGNDPMVGIVWYNGLEDIVIKWKDYKAGDEPPYKYDDSMDRDNYYTLQMVWMYLVLCFGNYGVSPRAGWIEDFEGYRKWFEELEKLMAPEIHFSQYIDKILEEGKLELPGVICTSENFKKEEI